MTTQNRQAIAERMRTSLGLQYPPIAVSFGNNGAEAPSLPAAVPAGCVFWQEAFRGPIKTSARDHELCSIGVYTHNLSDAPGNYEEQLGAVLKVLGDLEYVRPSDIPQIPVLKEQPKYVLYSPLDQAADDPSVVLLFTNARQGLVITEAVQQVEGAPPPVLGRPACAVIPHVVNSGKAAMSLGCCGARAYLDAMTDDIAVWALPGSKIGDYAGRIEALAKANDMLLAFHSARRRDVQSGERPTYEESLGRMK
jgi:uncharacterized protein (DUF169 family)